MDQRHILPRASALATPKPALRSGASQLQHTLSSRRQTPGGLACASRKPVVAITHTDSSSHQRQQQQRQRGSSSPSAIANAAATSPAAAIPMSTQETGSSTDGVTAQTLHHLLRLPVSICRTISLEPQVTHAQAVAALAEAVVGAAAGLQGLRSGVVRFEAPLPRGCTAASWLKGQAQPSSSSSSPAASLSRDLSSGEALSPSGALVTLPRAYYSGRQSSAPDTPLSARAERATKGWSAVAGAGSAWLWRGDPRDGGFGDVVVQQMQRFLSPDEPRIRVLGGTRFNPQVASSAEWAAFGSYCFTLPLVEFMESEDCSLLAVTLAWEKHAHATPAAHNADLNSASHAGGFESGSSASAAHAQMLASVGVGCADVESAVQRAVAALTLLQPPASSSAYAPQISSLSLMHSPTYPEWERKMGVLLQQLETTSQLQHAAAGGGGSSGTLDTEMARQEYMSHGQQGLDDLLAALNSQARHDKARSTVSRLGAQAHSPDSGGVLDATHSSPADDSPSSLLSKVVMARRSDFEVAGHLDPIHVLEALQERDPRSYQIYLDMGGSGSSGAGSSPDSVIRGGGGGGGAFVGCTPERLYARSGRFVASEAVAGTRPRGRPGDVEQDFWLALDLLRSSKDHAEFSCVRDWIQDALEEVCSDVVVEVPKSVLKQGSVQHLYGRLAGELKPGCRDTQLLQVLHPTPAVCGRPQDKALRFLQEHEDFDRGFYAGPFGWISGCGSEFVVAIRSALILPSTPPAALGSPTSSSNNNNNNNNSSSSSAAHPSNTSSPSTNSHTSLPTSRPHHPSMDSGMTHQAPAPSQISASAAQLGEGRRVMLFAGVGVVTGSNIRSEWQELDLKIRQFQSLLQPLQPLSSAPNMNAAWARMLVEELCRQGVSMFCVAPGSRSSALTLAVASHPRARLNVCIDERSLGFWALGYSRATGSPAAIITSSGTAVANLLPAVVEASLSQVPLLLLTADRPAEMRDTGANQTIDQVKIFGSFVRWSQDVPPPSSAYPGRTILTIAGAAVRHALSHPPGPVHLNMQFREPLAPTPEPWDRPTFLAGLGSWQAHARPFTTPMRALPASPHTTTAPSSLPYNRSPLRDTFPGGGTGVGQVSAAPAARPV
ncbi:MAG: hypothetical protein WDW38_002939 [Sanguina aurantia]